MANTPVVGSGGSDLGCGGLDTHSVAFAIDTFHFDGEPVSPSLQILQAGSVMPLAYMETGLGDTIRHPDFQWYASADYTPSGNNDQSGLLTGSVHHVNQGTFSVSAAVGFAALGVDAIQVFHGFTAGNGLSTDGYFVTSAVPVPVPEPGEWALLIASLTAVGLRVWRRADRR